MARLGRDFKRRGESGSVECFVMVMTHQKCYARSCMCFPNLPRPDSPDDGVDGSTEVPSSGAQNFPRVL
jgi:hypothetical protein